MSRHERTSRAPDGASVWDPLPSLSQTYVQAPPLSSSRTAPVDALKLLLLKVAAKVNERCHQPFAELQHAKLRPKGGIRTNADLAHALEYFKVVLSEDDLSLLVSSFQSVTDPGTVDMRALAQALFRRGEERAFGRDDTLEKARKAGYRGMRTSIVHDEATEGQQQFGGGGTQHEHQQSQQFDALDAQQRQQYEAAASLRDIGSSHLIAGAAASTQRKQGVRSHAADGAQAAAAVSGWQSQRNAAAPRSLESLHTARAPPRQQSLLSKAGGNSLAQHGTQRATPRYMQPASGASTARGAARAPPPRMDFTNLSRFDAARYERSQAPQEHKPYVHTAR